MKRSHECRRRAGRAEKPNGTTGAPVSAASATTPGCRRSAGPARPVGHHRHVLAGPHRGGQRAQRLGAAARRRAAHHREPEALHPARDQLAVARAAGQHARQPRAARAPQLHVEPGHHENAAVPDRVDQRPARRPQRLERLHALIGDPQRRAQRAHRRRRQRRSQPQHCASARTCRAARSPTPGSPSRPRSSANAWRCAASAAGVPSRRSASAATCSDVNARW